MGLFNFCISSVFFVIWVGWAPESRMNLTRVLVSASEIISIVGGM